MVADKSPDAFRTISEVAEELDLPQHVLRFWETRFTQIKPLKRGGGRRLYRSDDIDLLRGIRHLLYGEGYTIRGVQRILKEQGLRFVQTIWRDGVPSLEMPHAERAPKRPLQSRVGAKGPSAATADLAALSAEDSEDLARFSADQADEIDDTDLEADLPGDDAPSAPVRHRAGESASMLGPPMQGAPIRSPAAQPAATQPGFAPAQPSTSLVVQSPGVASSGPATRGASLAAPERRAEPVEPAPMRNPVPADVADVGLAATGTHGALVAPRAMVRAEPALPRGVLPGASPEPERQGSTFSFIDRLRGNAPRSDAAADSNAGPRSAGQLSRDDVRKLQSILFELLECKRVLDQTR